MAVELGREPFWRAGIQTQQLRVQSRCLLPIILVSIPKAAPPPQPVLPGPALCCQSSSQPRGGARERRARPSLPCPQPCMAPASLRLKAQVLPAAHRALHDLPVPSLLLLPLSPSFPLLQPHGPPRCSSITQARPAPGPLHRLCLFLKVFLAVMAGPCSPFQRPSLTAPNLKLTLSPPTASFILFCLASVLTWRQIYCDYL
jgi:hypothetical protein